MMWAEMIFDLFGPQLKCTVTAFGFPKYFLSRFWLIPRLRCHCWWKALLFGSWAGGTFWPKVFWCENINVLQDSEVTSRSGGGASVLRLAGCGSDPWPGQTKDCKNSLLGTQCSGLDQPMVPGCFLVPTATSGNDEWFCILQNGPTPKTLTPF